MNKSLTSFKAIFYIIFTVAIHLGLAGNAFAFEWFQSEGHEDVEFLRGKEYIINSKDQENISHVGLSFPIGKNTLATAAHIVANRKIGDLVYVGQIPALTKKVQWMAGRIAEINLAEDLAIIQLSSDVNIMSNNMIPICPSSPKAGTLLLMIAVDLDDGRAIRLRTSRAITTNLQTMPLVTPESNTILGSSTGQYPRDMFGKSRIVSAGSGESGESGGAMFDVQRQCVAGITSMTFPLDSLEDKDKVLNAMGSPPFSSLVIGSPIPQYIKH